VGSLNVQWHYQQAGEPSGVPILFLHGFMGHGGVWQQTVDQLPDGMFAVTPDLPGHGKTIANLEFLDFDSAAEAVAGFIEAQLNRPPVLVGYSMGGRIALYTALKFPEKFTGLVLESASPGISDAGERKKRLGEDKAKADKLLKTDVRTYLKEWYQLPVFDSLADKPELVEKIIQKKVGNDPAALAEVVVRLSPGVQPSLWDKLDRWDKTTLIIAGEKDNKFCEIARQMASCMPQGDLKIIPDAGHIVHLENNKDFASALNFFLSSYIL
jgi:2-succinyl-6-hydroxy-2,4-cyclohexadiene-1-carboxylate synthase